MEPERPDTKETKQLTEGEKKDVGLVERVREEGLAGATVLRGIEGFGRTSRLHTARILRLSEDLPILIEIVDTEERITNILPVLDEMIGEGLVTLEAVEILVYRSAGTAEAEG